MDFIEGLPLSNGHDAILVIVCRLTKMASFIPTYTDVTSEEMAGLFLINVFSKHGTPSDIISDRGRTFVSEFWISLCNLLGIKGNLSTAYHPQTDGQTERLNQILEQYLRIYINYQQDDWVEWLPLSEFAYNNSPHSGTGITPFFTNKGFHPKLEVSMNITNSKDAQAMSADLTKLHQYLKEELQKTVTRYEIATENRGSEIPEGKLKEGSMVWLNSKNIKTKRPMKKLDAKRLGPFRILKIISTHAYKLDLPLDMKQLHNVFHVSLLEPALISNIPGRHPSPPPPIELTEGDEYEVEAIVDSKIDKHRRQGGLLYRIKWKGYDNPEDEYSWEPPEN